MNASAEKTRYIQKVLALARSSVQHIEQLWRVKIDVSRFGSLLAPLFSSIISTAMKAVTQLASYSKTIRELSTSKILSFPPIDFLATKTHPVEEEHAPIETGTANVSFLLNVTVARKTAKKLTERIATKTPKPAHNLAPIFFEAQVMEETTEEPTKNVLNPIEGFQTILKSTTAPTLRSATSALSSAPLLFETAAVEDATIESSENAYPVFAALTHAVADLQSRFESKISASLQSIPSAVRRTAPLLPEYEDFKETTKKTTINEPDFIDGFQTSLKSKIAPSLQTVAFFFRKSSKQTIVPASSLQLSKPSGTIPSISGPPQDQSYFDLPEKDVTRVRSSDRRRYASSSVTSYPHKERGIKLLALLSIPIINFGAQPTKLFGYTAGLSRTLLQKIPVRATSPTFPTVSAQKIESIKAPVPIHAEGFRPEAIESSESAASLPKLIFSQEVPLAMNSLSFAFASIPKERIRGESSSNAKVVSTPSTSSRLMRNSFEKVSPYLTSWGDNVFESIQASKDGFSALSTITSTAEETVKKAFLQPIFRLKTPGSLTAERTDLTQPRPETAGKPVAVEAFKLPQIVSSVVVGLGQKYPLLFDESEINATLAPTVELAGVTPERPFQTSAIPRVKKFSKLPTLISLASTESLIVQRLQEESSGLMRGMYVSRSSPQETLGELGTYNPAKTIGVGKMETTSTLLSPRVEHAPLVASHPQRVSRPLSVRPNVQNTFNITIAAESTKQDLRDLERKISRILSDQIRRYYGSTRI